MKISIEGQAPIIIGKRVSIGAAVTSAAAVVAALFPDYAVAIIASAGVVTFIIQIIVVNTLGVTK